ncbi:MAG: uracil-DNA glycosylase [Acidobacteriota bacterium]|nr:uracil-DNA glycosylase [Acidobacteriota bacterium]
MSFKSPFESEFRQLTEATADYVRFLKEIGVAFLGAARDTDTLPATTSDTLPASPALGSSHFTLSPPTVSTAEVHLGETQLNGDEQPPPATELDRRQLYGESEIESKTLARTSAACNQPLSTLFQPQQNSLFGDSGGISAAAPDVSLEAVRADLGDCQRCKLARHRTHIVFGEGSPQARLVFVGEGPGAEEDATGRPFVGRAGQLLDKIIAAMHLKREDVYICNVVKCRPPENRAPERDEVAACVGFLHRQLAVIRPRVIVALGASAASALLDDPKLPGISKIRGRFYSYRGIPLMPTFHPAYLLRSPEKKREVWEDMKQVIAKLRESESDAP